MGGHNLTHNSVCICTYVWAYVYEYERGRDRDRVKDRQMGTEFILEKRGVDTGIKYMSKRLQLWLEKTEKMLLV